MKYKIIPEMNELQQVRFFNSFDDNNGSSDCWIWLSRKNKAGYGLFKFNGKEYYAHRISYHFFEKNLSSDMVLDHKCRNRACINPNHLRHVTVSINSSENTLNPIHLNSLKTHCKNGHEFTSDNTLHRPDGRRCRVCKRANEKGRVRKKCVRA